MAKNAKSNKNPSTSNDSNANNANFNKNDRKRLYEINDTVKLLVEEVKFLKTEIERTNRKAKRLEIENERLKKSVNLSLFKIDALKLPESKNNQDDGEEIVLKIAKLLNVDLQLCEIQRAHRLGKKPPRVFQNQDQLLYDSSLTKNEIRFYSQNQILKNARIFTSIYYRGSNPYALKAVAIHKKKNVKMILFLITFLMITSG